MTVPAELVIVGASLAGLRAAEALRAGGFAGTLTIVGAEPHPPYDRPPLSKQVLTATGPPPDTTLPVRDDLHARWLLGRPAAGLDIEHRTVNLSDGTAVPYDALVIATGAVARSWPGHRPPPHGVLTLRGLDDALRLRGELRPGRRTAVVGGGFLGSEVAAAARARGAHVTLLVAAEQPLLGAVGTEVGAHVAALHRGAGIDLRTGTTVEAFEAERGRLVALRLSDGSRLPADTAVLALGAVPATRWLAGAGLDIRAGIRCDAYLRALRQDGTVAPGVVVAGDVASVPHPLAGGRHLLLGHWTNAAEQGEAAARTLLHPDRPELFRGVPSFWSDLHGARIRSVGLPALADTVRVVEREPAAGRLEVAYEHQGRLVGALTIGRTARLAAYRQELQRRGNEATGRDRPVPARRGPR